MISAESPLAQTRESPPGTHEKALRINLDKLAYGAFAEIGAGQEVARWFFRVGGASGTIAKTMSAYDMTVSDAIYGHSDRYVSRQRLESMLDHEFTLLLERLSAKRGDQTRFFVFADTVAAQGFTKRDECHGWMGVRFQKDPQSAPSQILIHVRMLDPDNLTQQEALGIVGVNLIYRAIYLHERLDSFVSSLIDNLTNDRVEIDMIELSGPAFALVDNRLAALELVRDGLAPAAMFDPEGHVVYAADVVYKKSLLVARGSFRPMTKATSEMLKSAHRQFLREPQVQGEPVMVLLEMSLNNLLEQGKLDPMDFLDRVDLLGALGHTVLITSYAHHHRLAAYLHHYTKKQIAMVMGVPTLHEIFDEKYYVHLEGGILEAFGRTFKNDLKFYVHPALDPQNGQLITVENFAVAPNLRHLYAHLVQNNFIEGLTDVNYDILPIFSQDVIAKIKSRDPAWESMIPDEAVRLIKERRLFL